MTEPPHKSRESEELPSSVLNAIRELVAKEPRALFGSEPPPATQPGQRIGDFEILRPLGAGGMGEVWEARDHTLDRHVALKLVSPNILASPRALERFRCEAKAGAQLSHPNIVTVYSFGEHEGRHFIAQELVPRARTLAHLIDEQRRLPEVPPGYEDAIVELFVGVAEGLHASHRSGIIHRDVKPGNILITEDGRAKVADFGLAWFEGELSFSKTGDFVGTPHYMSPEQVAGGHAGLDHRTDVFSTGASLFEALTLVPPFAGASQKEALRNVLFRDPPDPGATNPRLSVALRRVCLRALATRPERRYASMGELAEDLRACLPSSTRLTGAALFQLAELAGRPAPSTVHAAPREHSRIFATAHGRDRNVVAPLLREWSEDERTTLEAGLDECDTVVFFLGRHGLDPQQRRDLARVLARASGTATHVLPVLLPGFEGDPPLSLLSFPTWIDLRRSIDDGRQRELLTVAALDGLLGLEQKGLAQRTRSEVCPFRGLLAFREEDSALFFGREAEAGALLERVDRHPFVGVVSASGAGKSSLIQAGLVPRLRAREGERWEVLLLTPKTEPVAELARAFVALLAPDADADERLTRTARRARELREGQLGLAEMVQVVLDETPGNTRLLVCVDQGEELFTTCRSPEERELFLELLFIGLERCGSLRVVLALRGDFCGRALESKRLAQHLQDATIHLAPMAESDLRRTIEGRAKRAGLALAPGLVESVVGDLRGEPGGLPLLEFYLRELWERSADGVLEERRSEAGADAGQGGVLGSISRAAESFYQSRSEEDRERLRRIFLRLVHPSEGAADTRRRACRAELEDGLDLVEALVQQERLLVADVEAGEVIFEVSHEALIRDWSRLRRWLDSNREFLSWRARLRHDVQRFDSAQELLTGGRLAEALRWRQERGIDLLAEESAFIDRSHARARRRRAALAAVLVGVVLTVVSVGFAFQRAARRQLEATDPLLLDVLVERSREGLVRGNTEEAILAGLDAWLGEARALRARRDGYRRGLAGLDEASARRARLAAMLARSEEFDREIRAAERQRVEVTERFGLWARCRDSVAADEAFAALDLPPQGGLLPLGRDERSGLWEFYVPGTGDTPVWEGSWDSGQVQPSYGMAVVLVLIPGGDFLMGAPEDEAGQREEEGPQHPVAVEPFFLGKYEVTTPQWDGLDDEEEPAARAGRTAPPQSAKSWNEIAEWGAKRGLRLPSEAEWEYACRAGSRTPYWSGAGESDLAEVGWYAANSDGNAHPVGAKQRPNRFGLHDMHGNLWEWCQDNMHESYEGAPDESSAWEDGPGPRVFRGGSFSVPADLARAATRFGYDPRLRDLIVGFRAARGIAE
ncbi:MAG: SUMF1/EgtB/PvdO family nonheme iron enzyme [Planctomycetota bacterium]